jgi:phenylalanyl-tRNA synthetase beta chain
MKVSRNWLQQYVDLADLAVADIAHALTMTGFEVEDVAELGLPRLDNVVIGEVVDFVPHANADRLRVCQVRVDAGAARTIVCGARNFHAGDRVIVALPGAELPGGLRIGRSRIRGVESNGMMCSERELGLSDNHEGIAVLAGRPDIGTPVNAVFSSGDTIFDLEITPNRPDALSHIGIARELAAWFKRELRYPEVRANPSAGPGGHLVQSVESATPENCPHYRGYSLRGVTVGESPRWLQDRLRAVGLRPINNIVDCTNFVLHETGQPLHAFDAAKIHGPRILVRMAGEGERIVTLDDKERALDAGMMVIADADRPLVVAGVMGAADSGVDLATRDVFLESAWFRPGSIRRTGRSLGLSTDSSYRFERGVDPNGTEYAALRCIDLILELAGGELLGPPLVAGDPPPVEKEIELRPDYVRERLGFDVSDADIIAHLESLELATSPTESEAGGALLRVRIPGFRQDLYRPIDLVEEILRLHGCERIPEGPVRASGNLAEDDPVARYQRQTAGLLQGRGFLEVMHYSLRSEVELTRWLGHEPSPRLRLANPLASDASHLRPSLLPGLLDCVALNQARHNTPRQLFETGRVFREHDGIVYEMCSVAFVIVEDALPGWKKREPADFYQAADIVNALLVTAGIRLDIASFTAIEGDHAWQAGHAARVGALASGYEARCGMLDLAMVQQWDIRGRILAGSVHLLPEFLQQPVPRPVFKPYSAFPPAVRDIAVLADHNLPVGAIRATIEELGQAACGAEFTLENVRVFDIYQGSGLPAGKKSVACELVFRSSARTLLDREVNDTLARIQSAIGARHDLALRG